MKWMDTKAAELINRLADTYNADETREVLMDYLWNEYKDEPTANLIHDVEWAEEEANAD